MYFTEAVARVSGPGFPSLSFVPGQFWPFRAVAKADWCYVVMTRAVTCRYIAVTCRYIAVTCRYIFLVVTQMRDFRRVVDEICALLGYYTASCGNCLPTFRDNVSFPSSRIKSPSRTLRSWGNCLTTFRDNVSVPSSDSRPVKMGPIRCPETSVNNYHTT
jgi:hypothetical protein